MGLNWFLKQKTLIHLFAKQTNKQHQQTNKQKKDDFDLFFHTVYFYRDCSDDDENWWRSNWLDRRIYYQVKLFFSHKRFFGGSDSPFDHHRCLFCCEPTIVSFSFLLYHLSITDIFLYLLFSFFLKKTFVYYYYFSSVLRPTCDGKEITHTFSSNSKGALSPALTAINFGFNPNAMQALNGIDDNLYLQ